ncbi:hypothetical protein [Endozoicomonas sp. GU-1]|uniref:hypothetical protein n=1 Tax=Endozoicomonas sp. GU-1 TaxID=3009078 RepID=UPI0022B438E6|nr:hypothetical protein [Endozoicomonas sp. GU-1]WBA81251.1 hypothetical protein O2T12_23655 [Endozoicomonas sp. GU-1]
MANPFPSIPSDSHPVVGGALDPVLLSADQVACCLPSATFDSRSTAIDLPEPEDLQMREFSELDISDTERDLSDAEKELHERAITHLKDHILQVISDTPSFKAKASMAREVVTLAQSIHECVKSEINLHLSSVWPDLQAVSRIVSQWPESLKESAAYVRYGWPVLTVGMYSRQFLCDFKSVTNFCRLYRSDYPRAHPRIHPDFPSIFEHFDPKDYEDLSQEEFQHYFGEFPREIQNLIKNPPPDFLLLKPGVYLDYPVFFRLARDIWLDALPTGNTGIMDRVSHLMVSFARQQHSLFAYRLDPYWDSLDDRLRNIHSLNYDDLSVIAFELATHPRKWQEKYQVIFRQLLSHGFSSEESQLMNRFDQWGADTDSQLKFSHWAESALIPRIVMTLHFLRDIVQYIDEHKSQHVSNKPRLSMDIERGDYFDKDTGQLLSPIIAADLRNTSPLVETREVLADFFRGKASQAGSEKR